MTIRVASFSYARQAIRFSSRHNANLLQAQRQISSGLSFERPSDEPIAFRQVTSLRTRFTELSADRNSIDRSTSILNASVDQLEGFNLAIVRAKSLTQQGIQALDDDARTALALEVDGLVTQMKGIATARFDDKYLFGGTQTDSPPFQFSDIDPQSGEISATYIGSERRSTASVGQSISVDTYYNGNDVFSTPGRGETVFLGSTGAASGTGTDTFVGRQTLDVIHDTTTYLGASGIQVGLSSGANDSIIGPAGAHEITIVDTAGDGSAGTISLNGAPPVAFTSADTDLRVEGQTGQVIFVDTTSISAGFNGNVDIESTGNLSIDGGTTQIAIDFTSTQVASDPTTGKFVTIDSQNIRQAGQEDLEFLGTTNAIELLAQIAADLRNTRGLTTHEQSKSLDRRLGELDAVAENTFSILGEQATSLRTMDSLGARVDDLRLSVETRASEVQSTDIPAAVLQLETSQALLQYTYAVTASLNSLGLLEFLR